MELKRAAVPDRRIAENLGSLRGKLAPATINCKKAALKKAIKATFRDSAGDLAWLAGLDRAFSEIKVPTSRFGMAERDVLTPAKIRGTQIIFRMASRK